MKLRGHSCPPPWAAAEKLEGRDGLEEHRENLLGEQGRGLDVAYSTSVLVGRLNLAAVALGIHRAVVDDTVTFTKSQRRYGKPLANLGVIKGKLGRMQSTLISAAFATYNAASLLDRGIQCDIELINAKLVNSRTVLDSARVAMEAHGAYGLLAHNWIERYLRDAYHTVAPVGTDDVQRLRLSNSRWEPRKRSGRNNCRTFSRHPVTETRQSTPCKKQHPKNGDQKPQMASTPGNRIPTNSPGSESGAFGMPCSSIPVPVVVPGGRVRPPASSVPRGARPG
ncbi:acyl-CoA dehydrogenase family protein [Saccharopolyspora sp. NPDC050389]|uniref:acyl-CoA dehydrogenase family protein n=1 Tax=Saccharopolyspora sp. NPDC050389 TaxID=3155516 RepID=UPI003408969B